MTGLACFLSGCAIGHRPAGPLHRSYQYSLALAQSVPGFSSAFPRFTIRTNIATTPKCIGLSL